MKRTIITVATLIALSIPAFAEAAQIKVTVQGMVCSFCAQGIEKKFKANPAVASVQVDLKQKFVLVTTKEGTTLDDATVRKIITDAGYKVTTVEGL